MVGWRFGFWGWGLRFGSWDWGFSWWGLGPVLSSLLSFFWDWASLYKHRRIILGNGALWKWASLGTRSCRNTIFLMTTYSANADHPSNTSILVSGNYSQCIKKVSLSILSLIYLLFQWPTIDIDILLHANFKSDIYDSVIGGVLIKPHVA